MSQALFDAVSRIARHEATARPPAALGKVVDAFGADDSPPDHAVDVELLALGITLPRVPVAVGTLGFAALPNVGDLVLVVFADGDLNAPVVAGRLYDDQLTPPAEAKQGKIALALPADASPPKLDLLIDGAAPTITLKLGDTPLQIDIDDAKVKIVCDKVELHVDSSGGGKVELKAGGSSIKIAQDGDIEIAAKGKLKLTGQEVEIEGQSATKVKGMQVDVQAQATATVKGATVSLG